MVKLYYCIWASLGIYNHNMLLVNIKVTWRLAVLTSALGFFVLDGLFHNICITYYMIYTS